MDKRWRKGFLLTANMLDEADTFVFQYQLINIKEYRHEDLLKSEIPEEIILAVLANFSNQPSEHVIRSILQRLQAVSKTENTLRKYIRQLGVLSHRGPVDCVN